MNGEWNTTRPWNVDQNFTKVHGRHEFQFGGRWRRETLFSAPDEPFVENKYYSQATALYDPSTGSSYGATPLTGFDGANFFIGVASNYYTKTARPAYALSDGVTSAYFQDNFKATSRLTLNLGLRYENMPAISERNNLLSGFDLKRHTAILGTSLENMYKLGVATPETVADYQQVGVRFETVQQAGWPDGVIKNYPWNFGPRAGFAYRLGSSRHATVIRGGYSLFRHNIEYNRLFTNMMGNDPPLRRRARYLADERQFVPRRT